MKVTTHYELWLSVLAPDRGHHARTNFWQDIIQQYIIPQNTHEPRRRDGLSPVSTRPVGVVKICNGSAFTYRHSFPQPPRDDHLFQNRKKAI